MILDTNHPIEPIRYRINFVNENLILSPLLFIVIKQILSKNLKKYEVLVIGRVSSTGEIFMILVKVLVQLCLVFVLWNEH